MASMTQYTAPSAQANASMAQFNMITAATTLPQDRPPPNRLCNKEHTN